MAIVMVVVPSKTSAPIQLMEWNNFEPAPRTDPATLARSSTDRIAELRLYKARVTAEDLYNLFYQGEHSKIVSETLDRERASLPVELVPPVVSALTFLGRIQEAELLFESHLPAFTVSQAVMCRFFLGVVKCRHFHFKEARSYFGQNARALRSVDVPAGESESLKLRFYVCQGFGFYRYTYGSLRAARCWATKSYHAAFQANFLFGRLFSQDLLAHTEINLGRTHFGLKLIDQNITLAQNLGRGALIQMFKVSRCIYRARFGIASGEAIEELLGTLAETTFEDGYSRACLLAELSHQYLMRGNASKAKETLNSACEYVYRIDNPRLEILLNFRIALLLAQQGELQQSLHLVRTSLKRLEDSVDRLLELRLRGLEFRLLSQSDNLKATLEISQRLTALTQRTGYFVGRRILARSKSEGMIASEKLQDPLGDLCDEIARRPKECVTPILESSWYGLLYKVCAIDVTSRTILIGLEGKSLTLFDRGNVRHLPRGASNQVAKFMLFLASGEKSKEQIIESVWEQRYHPLRHDPLLYSLVSKLRKELGPQAAWVEANENGYQLQPGVAVQEFLREVPREAAAPAVSVRSGQVGLNFRQQQILALLQKSQTIDVRVCSDVFKTSLATANRDLVTLEQSGHLFRSGKGRATRYHLNLGGSNETMDP